MPSRPKSASSSSSSSGLRGLRDLRDLRDLKSLRRLRQVRRVKSPQKDSHPLDKAVSHVKRIREVIGEATRCINSRYNAAELLRDAAELLRDAASTAADVSAEAILRADNVSSTPDDLARAKLASDAASTAADTSAKAAKRAYRAFRKVARQAKDLLLRSINFRDEIQLAHSTEVLISAVDEVSYRVSLLDGRTQRGCATAKTDYDAAKRHRDNHRCDFVLVVSDLAH
jgi:hypothetical protein